MCKTYVIRHGQSVWNEKRLWAGGNSDIPLTDLGRRQAQDACERLRRFDFACVSSSGLIRARETATIIAERLGLELLDPFIDLNERDFGLISGMTSEQIQDRYPGFYRDWKAGKPCKIPEGEAWDLFLSRIKRGMKRIAAIRRSCLIVTHMSVLRAIEHLLGVPQTRHQNLEGVWVDPAVLPMERESN